MTVSNLAKARGLPRQVKFTGDGLLVKGLGLCYDRDRGTAANVDGERDNFVELPTSSNNAGFAGVTAQPYAAVVGGQTIYIWEPGSFCDVAISIDTVVNAGLICCSANSVDAGRFSQTGFHGRGSARPLQTNANGVLISSYDGTAALDTTGLIITDTGAFVVGNTAAGVTYDIYIVAGEDDNTDLVTGLKTTGSRTDDNTFTIASVGSTTGGTMTISYYIVTADSNETAFCELLDGPESGLQQVYQITNGANTGLLSPGYNFIHGLVALSADATETLADGIAGDRVGIKMLGTPGSNDYLLTVTNGFKADGVTAMTTAELDADLDEVIFEMGATEWMTRLGKGAAFA